MNLPELLVFALFFQTGLDYTPLQSGLAVTPFAIGSASAAVVAGRMVERYGRALTVFGLSAVMAGLAAAAVFCPDGRLHKSCRGRTTRACGT